MSGPSAKELEKSAIKCGWLTKFGGNGLKSNWRKRWFVLHDDFLYYFKTQSVSRMMLGVFSFHYQFAND